MGRKECLGFVYALFLSVFPLLCSANSTDPLEVEALLSIKARLIDPVGNLQNWNTKYDPCNLPWSGLICHKNVDNQGYRHVAQLELLNKNLSGNLASEIGNLQYLKILDFMWNNISGSIPRTIGNLTYLELILVNGNQLTGPLPEEIGYLPNLDRIQIDQNKISGHIPKSFANLPKTKHFHMNNNSLSGEIPSELSRLPKLVHLLLDNNNLTGKLPPELANTPSLLILQLDNNNFSGSEIPPAYGNMSKLLKLSLRNCSLQGSVPDLSNITNLGYLDLSYNELTGNIPTKKLSSAITTIDLSHNHLNGTIPSSFADLPILQKLSLDDNQLSGSVPSDIGLNITFNSSGTLLLDYRNNRLNNITDDRMLERLPSNISLRLDGNPLCSQENRLGVTRFCRSSNITEDSSGRSNNTLCATNTCSPPYMPFPGPGCHCVAPINFGYRLKSPGISAFPAYMSAFERYLTDGLNLSLNQLSIDSYEWQSGPRLAMNLKFLPNANQGLTLFNNSEIQRIHSKFAGWLIPDSDVFGPYEWINSSVGAPYTTAKSSGLKGAALAGVIVGSIIGTLIVCSLIGLLIFRHYSPYIKAGTRRFRARKRVKVAGVKDFDFHEMAAATNNFDVSMRIGRGGYGDVYRGILPDGTAVAIKRARVDSMQGEQEFANELELLSRLHHRNLVSLIGYCDDRDEQMLVYEYMPNGSLKDHLQGRSEERPMDFTMRLRIALGSARGIVYLHTEANPPIFHRDIKATNILLDERFHARVADFGLSRLAPVPEDDGSTPGYVSTIVKGTPGYLDPEYFQTHKLTDKSDVYSFGVVLLELLTGMEPISYGRNLAREVTTAYAAGKVLKMTDPHMVSYPPEGTEKLFQLAIRCCNDDPDLRPSMLEVVEQLTEVQNSAPAETKRPVESLTVVANEKLKTEGVFSSSEISGSDLYDFRGPSVTPR